MLSETGDPLIDSIVNYLQTNSAGTIGTTLFSHQMPRNVERGIFVVNSLKGSKVDPYLPGWRDVRFRIITRGADHPDVLGQLNAVLPLLEINETQLDSVYIKHMHYENDPIVYPQSYNSGLYEASVILTATYYLIA